MGELEPWIDENFIRNIWYQMGEQVNVKMIRDKFSGYVTPPDVALLIGHVAKFSVLVVTPDIVSLILRVPRPLLKLCPSMEPQCPTPTVPSSSTGLLVVVCPIGSVYSRPPRRLGPL